MRTQITIKLLGTLLFVIASNSVMAQSSAKQGMERLQTNMKNAQTNLEGYQKNLKLVQENITEVEKAVRSLNQDRQDLTKLVTDHQALEKSLVDSEVKIDSLMTAEQAAINENTRKIQELEAALLAIKDNQTKRQANLAQYQKTKTEVQTQKSSWSQKKAQLDKAGLDLKTKHESAMSQYSEWKNKEKGYQGEVGRWQKEVERNKKLLENYSSLSDVKE